MVDSVGLLRSGPENQVSGAKLSWKRRVLSCLPSAWSNARTVKTLMPGRTRTVSAPTRELYAAVVTEAGTSMKSGSSSLYLYLVTTLPAIWGTPIQRKRSEALAGTVSRGATLREPRSTSVMLYVTVLGWRPAGVERIDRADRLGLDDPGQRRVVVVGHEDEPRRGRRRACRGCRPSR